MRKKAKDSTDLQPTPDKIQEIAKIIPIRTEAAINQFPFYRLSKGKEPIQIAIVTESKRGKVSTQWEVSPNQKYGHPGSLAYKLDTLLINRLIDKTRPHIPELLKLGSMREICEELGLVASGENTNGIKKALHQNASAYITANLLFQGNDGTEREFKFGATRYEVIFYGEKLPNGRRADAVYIVFHRSYHEMLSHARTRPLDYGYLKELPPSSQRLYELIAPQIFSALKNDNPRAKYPYSEFCQRAPLTRYHEWEDVKKQLYKVHRPHRESGYLKAVEFEETVDASGVIDWVMWYTPGRKAKAEFKRFNTKEGRELDKQQRQRPRLVGARKAGRETTVPERTPEDSALIEKLRSFGVTNEATACSLVANYRESVELEIEAFSHRRLDGVKNPAGLLIAAIRSGDYSQPPQVEAQRAKRAAEKAAAEKKRLEEARESYKRKFLPQYLKRAMEELSRIERERPEVWAEFSEFVRRDREKAERLNLPDLQVQEVIVCQADWFFNDGYREKHRISFPEFWDWDKKENPDRYDPS